MSLRVIESRGFVSKRIAYIILMHDWMYYGTAMHLDYGDNMQVLRPWDYKVEFNHNGKEVFECSSMRSWVKIG
jgi:hypothetical protein